MTHAQHLLTTDNWGQAVVETAVRSGRTAIVHQYSQAPLQWLGPLDPQAHRPILYLRNPNGGLLNGDRHSISVSLAPDTHLDIRTQSATRLHPGQSRQDITISLGDRSSLMWVAHPLIPGSQTTFSQTITIDLAPTARLAFGEIWTAGRLALDAQFAHKGVPARETWQCQSLSNHLAIQCAGSPVLQEVMVTTFPHTSMRSPSILGDFGCWGSLYLLGDWPQPDWPETETQWMVKAPSALSPHAPHRILRSVGNNAIDMWDSLNTIATTLESAIASGNRMS